MILNDDVINAGVAVALGSDFNPNAYCMSMVSPSPVSLKVGKGPCGGGGGGRGED